MNVIVFRWSSGELGVTGWGALAFFWAVVMLTPTWGRSR